ncbi:class I SAM-dependent DNA methyltransferase [Paeniglutamicibacter cryotolerans]|uniref:SAM-dependent methyltransferase n=1 Tax=Paeniglutamicibacter cryotolerans TaxID=670079 RepID=A0A839QEX3_9MICC|nr:class I SAM-dependent methyltransferase [Paeniglutamicibacter cryotolerans]MBB2994163.1 SAM-dependent methyltransferase [Paeniglutamicibacter cryotolerans]
MTETRWITATRSAYDTVAIDYAQLLLHELDGKSLDRALLAVFAEQAGQLPGRIADLGCGPGRVTRFLSNLGADVFGMDLSPKMVEVARNTYPDLRFGVGSMESLDLDDATLSGIVAWYSIIHAPPHALPGIFAEFHRTLIPGGCLLLAFQAGDARVDIKRAYGHEVDFDGYRLDPGNIAALLADAGLTVESTTVREPGYGESTPQAYLLASKAAA